MRISRTIPDDFAHYAAIETNAQLRARYGCWVKIITRWRQQSGVFSRQDRRSAAARAAKKVNVHSIRSTGNRLKAPDAHYDDGSQATKAQRFLQHYGPLWRCTRDGEANKRANFYTTGKVILTADEMMARALRKGWNPDEWKMVA